MAAERRSLHTLRHLREIGPEGGLPGPGDMALEAGQMRGVEDESAAAGVATGGHVGHKPFPRLGEERLGQALGASRRRRLADSHEADHRRHHEKNSRLQAAHGNSSRGFLRVSSLARRAPGGRGIPRE